MPGHLRQGQHGEVGATYQPFKATRERPRGGDRLSGGGVEGGQSKSDVARRPEESVRGGGAMATCHHLVGKCWISAGSGRCSSRSFLPARPATLTSPPSPEQLPRRPPLLRHPTKAHSSPNVGADRQGPGKSCCFYLPLKEAQVRRISLRPTKPPLICARQSSVFPLAFIRWASFTLPIRIEQKSPGKKKKKRK